MSRTIAVFIQRRRVLLSTLIILGAIALAPGANFTEIDNDITAWFSREDPVYLDYERFRAEFGGTRTLIIALKPILNTFKSQVLSAQTLTAADFV